MFTDKTQQKLIRSKENVNDAENHFLTIHAIPKEGNFARMNAQTNPQLLRKQESVLIARNHLRSIHHLPISAVRWRVEQLVPRLQIGHSVKEFCDSVFNAEKSSGDNNQKSKKMVGSIAPSIATMKPILFHRINLVGTISTRVRFGRGYARRFSNAMGIVARLADSTGTVCTFTTKKLDVMAEMIQRTILSAFVIVVTENCMLVSRKLASI
jgi:hypothetical protein